AGQSRGAPFEAELPIRQNAEGRAERSGKRKVSTKARHRSPPWESACRKSRDEDSPLSRFTQDRRDLSWISVLQYHISMTNREIAERLLRYARTLDDSRNLYRRRAYRRAAMVV